MVYMDGKEPAMLDSIRNQSLPSKIKNLSVKPRHSSGGFLAKILSTLLMKRTGMGAIAIEAQEKSFMEIWNDLINKYLNDPRNGINIQDRDTKSSARGNITKELTRPEITWKVFCKGLRVINACKMELSIKLHLEDGTIIEHEDVLNI